MDNMYNNCCNTSSHENMDIMDQALTMHQYSENTKGVNIFQNMEHESLFEGLINFFEGKETGK